MSDTPTARSVSAKRHPRRSWLTERGTTTPWKAVAVVAALFALAGCSPTADTDAPAHPLTSAAPSTTNTAALAAAAPCPASGTLDAADPWSAIEAAVAELGSIANGSGDGCQATEEPLCAAIFLIAATDPVAALDLDAAGRRRMVDLHEQVLRDATTIAERLGEDRVRAAFEALIDLDVAAAFAADDPGIAAFAVARSAPEVVEAIVAAEQRC